MLFHIESDSLQKSVKKFSFSGTDEPLDKLLYQR